MKMENRAGPLMFIVMIMFLVMFNNYCAGSSESFIPGERKVVDDYSFETEDRKKVSISDFRGKILVLETGACISGG